MTDLRFLTFQRTEVSVKCEVEVIALKVLWVEILKTSSMHSVKEGVYEGHSRIEPPHDKTNIMACAASEDSDQPGHLPSLISLRCPHKESFGP